MALDDKLWIEETRDNLYYQVAYCRNFGAYNEALTTYQKAVNTAPIQDVLTVGTDINKFNYLIKASKGL